MPVTKMRTPVALSAAMAAVMLLGSAGEGKAMNLEDTLKQQLVIGIVNGVACKVSGGCRNDYVQPPSDDKVRVTPPPKVDHAERRRNREVQTALNSFGFNPGNADGILGRKSRGAISGLQGYMGWTPTGYLDAYQRGVLVDAHARFRSGAGNYPPYSHAVARDGVRGFVKAVANPGYLDSVQPHVPPPPQPRDQGPISGENPFPKAETLVSMTQHCEIVDLSTQTNGALQTAASMTDPAQALDELFCEGHSYAQAEAHGLLAKARATEDSLMQDCAAIRDAIAPEVADLLAQGPQAATAHMAQRTASLGLKDPDTVSGYGKLCLGLGYRGDDADMALASALILLGAGKTPYAEIIAHHMRSGFGTDPSPESATHWYAAAFGALANGAMPEIAPSRSAERHAVAEVALSGETVRGGAGNALMAGQVIVPQE